MLQTLHHLATRKAPWKVPVLALGVLAGLAAFVRVPSWPEFGAFLAFIILAELLEVRLAAGATSSLGIAPALAYALIGHSIAETALLYAAGSLTAHAIARLWRPGPSLEDAALRFLVVVVATGAYTGFGLITPPPSLSGVWHFGHDSVQITVAGFLAMVLVVLTLGATLRSAIDGRREQIPRVPLLLGTLRATAPVNISAISAGALLALAYPVLVGWSLPLFLAPLVATHYSFRQLSSIQHTYLQTIRALSKVPEMAGYNRPGHSTRVAELTVEIAREMGMSDTTEMEYAALLHDIGRLSLPDPDPDATGADHVELAHVGATIVEETGHFPEVAKMIRRQSDPYRTRGEDADRHLPLGARIIKVASAYDDLTRPGGLGRSPWDALERLHLGTAYDFDPGVIQALTKVLEKRGAV